MSTEPHGQYPNQYSPQIQYPEPPNKYKNHNRNTLLWVFGILGGVVLVAIISVVSYVQIKDQNQKNDMIAVAERIIPESDWVDVSPGKPYVSGSSTCISFDNDCHVLIENWEATEPVDIEKMADQLGIPMEHTTYPEDCMRSTEDGGRVEICAYLSERAVPGKWLVSLSIRES